MFENGSGVGNDEGSTYFGGIRNFQFLCTQERHSGEVNIP
jgi:hypothetical protein